jgi:recombinational DNA repair protein (RecF pathway)
VSRPDELELLLGFAPVFRPTCQACGSDHGVAFAAFSFDGGESLCLDCWNVFAPVFLAAAARGRVA